MRPLLIDDELPSFQAKDGDLSEGAAQVIGTYAKRHATQGKGRIVVVGNGASKKQGLGHLQRALQKYSAPSASGGSLSDSPAGEHALQLDEVETLSNSLAGANKTSAYHGGVFLSSSAQRCRQAAEAGLVPYLVPQGADDAASLSKVADTLADHLRFESCHKKLGSAPGRSASTATKSISKSNPIEQLIANVDSAKLKATLQQLVAFGTRWSYGSNISQVTQAIHDDFIAAGYSASDIAFQPFTVPQAPAQRNVLCGPTASTSKYVLLCAHYDSFSQSPQSSAPGCDDDASGIAVIIEAARVLKMASLSRPVVFAAFGGEEQGLFGSRHCAEVAAANGWNIDVVINLDMVGHQPNPAQRSIVVEYDQNNAVATNDSAAKAFAMQMAQAAADYTDFTVTHTNIWNSDYMPFEAKGYPCIGLYDGAAEETFYHTTQDTIDKIDLTSLQNVTRLLVATVAQISGLI